MKLFKRHTCRFVPNKPVMLYLPWVFIIFLAPLAVFSRMPLPYSEYFLIFLVMAFATGVLHLWSNRSQNITLESKEAPWEKYLIPAVSALFLLITLAFPLLYSGSYIDEYLHLNSGKELFQSGHSAEIYTDGEYNRGLPVSWGTGLFMYLFGDSLLAAKYFPALLALISFLLLSLTANIIGLSRKFTAGLLLVFTLNPFLLFEHFYIRSYVLNECLLMAILLLSCLLLAALRKQHLLQGLIAFGGILAIPALYVLWSNHDDSLLILFAAGIALAYLFLFESKNIRIPDKKPIFHWINRFFSAGLPVKFALFVIVATGIGILIHVPEQLDFLLHGEVQYGSMPGRNYPVLFFRILPVFTVFFFLAAGLFFTPQTPQNSSKKLLLTVAYALFCLHLVTADGLQIIRAIIYFLPLFFLAAFMAAENLLAEKRAYSTAGGIICGLALLLSFPQGFWKHPELPFEAGYVEYQKAYEYVKSECAGRKIIETALVPVSAQFHGVALDAVLLTDAETLKSTLFDSSEDGYHLNFGNIPVISDTAGINALASEKYCYIQRTLSLEKLVDSAETAILTAPPIMIVNFENMRIYRN